MFDLDLKRATGQVIQFRHSGDIEHAAREGDAAGVVERAAVEGFGVAPDGEEAPQAMSVVPRR